MNRRSLLKTILGAGAALIGGRAIAEEKSPLLNLYHPGKNESYKGLYGQAQAQINKLEAELAKHEIGFVHYKVESDVVGEPLINHGFAQPKAEGTRVLFDG